MEQVEYHNGARKGDTAWLLASVGLGFCIASKESVRYTALWYFDEKPFLLVLALGLFFLCAFGIILKGAKNKPLRLYEKPLLLTVLAIAQCSGMVIHTLAAAGLSFPKPVEMLSFFGIESSLLLLAVYAEYLFLADRKNVLTAFIYGASVAGVLQIVTIFLDVVAARWIVSLFAAASVALLALSLRSFHSSADDEAHRVDSAGQRGGEPVLGEDRSDELSRRGKRALASRKDFAIPDFVWFCAIIFLVSVVLMGAYSQWRSQQDGQTASALIQVCSGLGMLAAAFLIRLARNYVQNRSLFFLCQTLAFPITLGALYLATIFEGPSVSLSVLLFDAAYVVVLFAVWLAPFVYSSQSALYVCSAGLLSYKMGWAVGVLSTATLPSMGLSWAGTVVVTVSFLALVVLSTISLVRNYKDTDDALAAEPEYGYESACRIVGERYGLTNRENDVLLLLAKGRTASYMARDLVLSESTVRTHIAHIYKKMKINSQQELLDEIERTHKDSCVHTS